VGLFQSGAFDCPRQSPTLSVFLGEPSMPLRGTEYENE
jgi:hypothetical protein